MVEGSITIIKSQSIRGWPCRGGEAGLGNKRQHRHSAGHDCVARGGAATWADAKLAMATPAPESAGAQYLRVRRAASRHAAHGGPTGYTCRLPHQLAHFQGRVLCLRLPTSLHRPTWRSGCCRPMLKARFTSVPPMIVMLDRATAPEVLKPAGARAGGGDRASGWVGEGAGWGRRACSWHRRPLSWSEARLTAISRRGPGLGPPGMPAPANVQAGLAAPSQQTHRES